MNEKIRLKEAVSFSIGKMVGVGIFAVPGLAVTFAREATPLAFLFAAIIVLISQQMSTNIIGVSVAFGIILISFVVEFIFKKLNMENPSQNKSDLLALARSKLANERTFLAYFRTAVVFFSSGFAILKLGVLKDIVSIAYLLSILAPLMLVIGIFRYYYTRRQLRKVFDNKQVENIFSLQNSQHLGSNTV